jgi:spore maturation protein A
MQDLQSLNGESEKITAEMMLFIVINTASIQLVPFTVIGILAAFGSKNPSWVVFPTFLATVLSAGFAVGALWVCRRILK